MTKDNRLFDRDTLEKAVFHPGQLGSPGIFDVGLVHWLAHKFGWHESRAVICRDEDTTFIGFQCVKCEYISIRNYKQEVYAQHRRTDWPEDLWPKSMEAKHLDKLKSEFPDPKTFRDEYLGTWDPPPDYCVCRVPERPLVEGSYCRECFGKVREVRVIETDLIHTYENIPFEGRVIGRSADKWWIQSIRSGKQYQLYEHQFEDLDDG